MSQRARRLAIRLLVVTGLVLAAGAAGYWTTSHFGGELLRDETERQLARLFKGPVAVEQVRLSFRGGLRLEGQGVAVYPSPQGPRLTGREVDVGIDLPSLVIGRFRLAWLSMRGVQLKIERNAEGHWSPYPFGALEGKARRTPDDLEKHLSLARAAESATRFLLERPVIADRIDLESGTITFTDRTTSLAESPGAPLELELRDVAGVLEHHWFRDDADLQLRGELILPDGRLSHIEASGVKGTGDRLQISVAATGLPLGTFEPYARGAHPDAHLSGSLTGVLDFATAEREHAEVEIDWVLEELDAALLVARGSEPLASQSEKAQVYARLEIHPGRLRLATAEVNGRAFEVTASASADRPLREASHVRLDAEIRGVGLPELHRAVAALPEEDGAPLVRLLERVRSGHIGRVDGRGEARVAQWRKLLSGELRRLPEGFVLGAAVDALEVDLGAEDRLTETRGLIHWSGDRIAVQDAQGLWNGSPLPGIDLEVEGVSALVDARPEDRARRSQVGALRGLPALRELLGLTGEGPPSSEPGPRIDLAFDHFEHPAFLWPVADARLHISGSSRERHYRLSQARWAGVPVSGELVVHAAAAGPRVRAHLSAGSERTARARSPLDLVAAAGVVRTAQAAQADEEADTAEGVAQEPLPAVDPERPWAVGRIEIADRRIGVLPASLAFAQFELRGERGHFHDVQLNLEPSGSATGRIDVDVAEQGVVGVDLDYSMKEADLPAVVELFEMRPELVTGRVSSDGQLAGRVWPGRLLLSGLSGEADTRPRAGTLRRRLPLLLAMAQATESWNDEARRETVHFEKMGAKVSVEEGRFATDRFILDGPMQLFASGHWDGARASQEVDALVGVFLFPNAKNVLSNVPLINAFLPGSSRGLVGAYFELSGSFEEPEVKPLPLKSLAEELPEVVKAPLRAIKALFKGRRGDSR